MVRNACKKHKDKIFFVGTQQRSDTRKFLRAVNMVQKGLLGTIKKITIGVIGAHHGDRLGYLLEPDPAFFGPKGAPEGHQDCRLIPPKKKPLRNSLLRKGFRVPPGGLEPPTL